jgi:hypothetical protein
MFHRKPLLRSISLHHNCNSRQKVHGLFEFAPCTNDDQRGLWNEDYSVEFVKFIPYLDLEIQIQLFENAGHANLYSRTQL